MFSIVSFYFRSDIDICYYISLEIVVCSDVYLIHYI